MVDIDTIFVREKFYFVVFKLAIYKVLSFLQPLQRCVCLQLLQNTVFRYIGI